MQADPFMLDLLRWSLALLAVLPRCGPACRGVVLTLKSRAVRPPS
jgi:hypothetical protein